jgi:hypothetical protein
MNEGIEAETHTEESSEYRHEYKREVWRYYAGCALTYAGSPQGAAEIADRMLEYEFGRFGEPK